MGNKNLYIPVGEEALIERLESILKERNRNLSEFFISAARSFVESIGETEEIILESPGLTRKLQGRWVFRIEDTDYEMGVILTKRGKIVYWCDVPMAIEQAERTKFRVFDDLRELADAELLEEDQLAEVAAELGEQIVQELDI